MPFLSEADQEQLQRLFDEELADTVRLRVLTRPPSRLYIPGQPTYASCGEVEPLVRELAALSEKLEIIAHDVLAEPSLADQYCVGGLLPAIFVEPVSAECEAAPHGALRFFGLPAGYEFSTLVADIIDVSTGRLDLSESTQEELRGLDEDLHLQVFVTPT